MRLFETAHQAFVRHVIEAHGRQAVIEMNGPATELHEGAFRLQINLEHPPGETPALFRRKIQGCINRMNLDGGSGLAVVKGPDRELTHIVLFSKYIHPLRDLAQAILPFVKKPE